MRAREGNDAQRKTATRSDAPAQGLQDRALDALVAEKVMGAMWTPNRAYPGHGWLCIDGVAVVERIPRDGRRKPSEKVWDACPRYSTSIAAAWMVVEKLSAQYEVRMFASFEGSAVLVYDPELLEPLAHEVVDPRIGGMPLAICRAALASCALPDESAAGASTPATDAPAEVTP